MSARYEITCDDDVATVTAPGGVTDSFSRHGTSTDRFGYGAIRQQARDIADLLAECDLLTHKVICCGVAAWHSDPLLTTTGAYAREWNSPQADCVRKLRAERDQLRADLAAAVAENAALLAANRDCIWHFDAIKADYDAMKLRAEQAEARLARNTCEYCDGTGDVHAPTGEWRGECDCVYAQNNKLRARLAAIDGAPTVATVCVVPSTQRVYVSADVEQYELPPIGTHLIARPAKD